MLKSAWPSWMMSVGEMGKGTRYAFKGKPGKNTFFLSFKVPATSKFTSGSFDIKPGIYFDCLEIIYGRFLLSNENRIQIFHWNRGKTQRIPDGFTPFDYKMLVCPDKGIVFFMFMLIFDHFCDGMWFLLVERICTKKICLFDYTNVFVLSRKMQLPKGDPINQFSTATYLCLSKARTWNSNAILFFSTRVKCDSSFWWYWCHCWPSLAKLNI